MRTTRRTNTQRWHISRLEALIHELTGKPKERGYIYLDDLRRLTREIRLRADRLYPVKGHGPEGEARLCNALLLAYSSLTVPPEDEDERRERLLFRSYRALSRLPRACSRHRQLMDTLRLLEYS